MDKKAIEMQGVKILGTTLWSYIPDEHVAEISTHLNDFKKISLEDSDHEGQSSPITVSEYLPSHQYCSPSFTIIGIKRKRSGFLKKLRKPNKKYVMPKSNQNLSYTIIE